MQTYANILFKLLIARFKALNFCLKLIDRLSREIRLLLQRCEFLTMCVVFKSRLKRANRMRMLHTQTRACRTDLHSHTFERLAVCL